MLLDLLIIRNIEYFICENFSNISVLQWKKNNC